MSGGRHQGANERERERERERSRGALQRLPVGCGSTSCFGKINGSLRGFISADVTCTKNNEACFMMKVDCYISEDSWLVIVVQGVVS
ncbi:hypothetical protein Hanom_Chr07g00619541 [Helianthus anomalus]